ncbi:MAG TPA: outer membrane protein assembly factor BamA [Burkholderiales bacterium]|nr:outer membrane protein assembly factor BamA [Burkholderiales bacterium]
MKLKYLVAILSGLYATSAFAISPFVVKNIKVEGIQRTEPGTVFSYLPVKVGDTMDDEKSVQAIKALYATGFFKDVRIEAQGNTLIVVVAERPAIGSIEINGAKEIKKEDLKKGLKQIGLAESRILDRSLLDKAVQELKRQYIGRGHYAVKVEDTVTPLERNRVAVSFNITEGDVAKIHRIEIIGNHDFKEKDLLDLFSLSAPNWLSWITDDDKYSRNKLAADEETLRAFYQNRGYLEFAINSINVSITPDKKDIYITIIITEGPKYTISGIKFAGDKLIPESDLRKIVDIKAGDIFNREKVTDGIKNISDRLGDEGYAFANVNALPDLDKKNHTATFTFSIDPGHRVYVRRINITGNTRTRDEVIRREFRQMEGGWYMGQKIKDSKSRVDRLGYFSETNIETPAVIGTNDQVDLNMSVTERPTGNISVGAGFASAEGLILTGSVSENNIFGTGNQASISVNTSILNRIISLSYTNPYYTDAGTSLGYDLYKRDINPSALMLGQYQTSTTGAGVRLGVPVTDNDIIHYGLALEETNIVLTNYAAIYPYYASIYPIYTSPLYSQFIQQFGNYNSTVKGTIGWSRDTRNNAFFPTEGSMVSAYTEMGLPGGSLKYYKVTTQDMWFHTLYKDFTLMLNGMVGFGGGYGGKPLPFFDNFYAGGVGSVRGYDINSLGPRDIYDEPIGGNKVVTVSGEVYFPMPGIKDKRSVRLSTFVDGGQVYGNSQVPLQGGGLRYAAGVALTWISPVGPLKFSIAQPLNAQPLDNIQRFQFMLGNIF